MIRRICIVVASEMTVKAFLLEHLRQLSGRYELTLVANTRDRDFLLPYCPDIEVIPVTIAREINPWSDFRSLLQLYAIFRQGRFDLVHSVTPKAGLLAMLAGGMAGVRLRLHTFTGQVWVTYSGYWRLLLKTADRLLALSATHLLADSLSQRQFLIDQRIVRAKKISVLADGSISGVNVERFRPDGAARPEIRKQLGVNDDAILLLFLGRLNRDKGVLDLARAFARLAVDHPRLHLLLVGPDEGALEGEVRHIVGASGERLHFVGYTDKPESWFAAADIFCLPSYREGFGSVVIEAAACGVPAIASRIYGISDAVREHETGLLFEAGDIDGLAGAIRVMVADAGLRRSMGEAACRRARAIFPGERLVRAWQAYYDGLE